MNELAYLSYFPDPFDVKDSRYFVLNAAGVGSELTAPALGGWVGPVATYETQLLVDDLRRSSVAPPTGLFGIDDALRLLSGRPRDEGGGRSGRIWRHLAPLFAEQGRAEQFKNIVLSKINRPDAAVEIAQLLAAGADALRKLWEGVQADLHSQGEFERFANVDVPIQQLFFNRQYRGIPVNFAVAESLLRSVSHEKYQAYSRVAQQVNRSPNGLSFWSVQKLLHMTDASDVVDEKDGGRLRELFKLIASRSQFARDYLSYTDSDRDESILRRALIPERVLHPEFSSHGTVTGRILVADPHLQQLRRKYRAVISPEQGRRLQYLDYAQFEPGVLAFLCADDALIRAYNSGDIYESLSEAVYGTKKERALSKRVFLAYLYGMTPDRIAKLVLGPNGKSGELAGMGAKIDAFFCAFPRLQAFRAECQERLERDGRVGSLFGNYRRRVSDGPLSSKEKRWAMNQVVQATASLIFKEALIGIANKLGRDVVLLPMHDAVLLQFPEDTFDNDSDAAVGLMQEAFARRCPGVSSRIAAGAFSG